MNPSGKTPCPQGRGLGFTSLVEELDAFLLTGFEDPEIATKDLQIHKLKKI